MSTRGMASGLAWFGIGIGIIELLATKQVARAVGLARKERHVRMAGVREIANGIGILAQRRTDGTGRWMWGRVIGDAIDLTLLGYGVASAKRARRISAGAAIGSVAVVTLADAWVAARMTNP